MNDTIPPLNEAHKANFTTLQRAVNNGDIALMSCRDKKTGENVAVVCAVQPDPDVAGGTMFVPLAKMFNTNPYDEVEPP